MKDITYENLPKIMFILFLIMFFIYILTIAKKIN